MFVFPLFVFPDLTALVTCWFQPKVRKNVSHDAFGTKLGRVHMTTQDLSQLPDRRMKRIRKLDTNRDTAVNAASPPKQARESAEED